MRKIFGVLLSILCICCAAIGLTGCKKDKHIHAFDKQVITDEYKATDATCTEKATYYYSCSCEEKGTETFGYGDPLGHSFTNYVSDNNVSCTQDGTKTAKCDRCSVTDTIAEEDSKLPHTFDKQVASEKYLASPATCTEAAKYYYSCSCGEKGTETFTYGDPLGHSFTNYASDNNATCTQDGTKTAKCDHKGCHETDTIADVGSKFSHTFDKQVATEKYLASAATCTEAAKYYYSCECGEKGTETFGYGDPLGHSFTNYASDNNATCTKDGTKTAKCDHKGCHETDTIADVGSKFSHTFDKQVANEKYLASPATCTEAAKYYYSCECGEKGTETFGYGDPLGHSFTNYVSDHNATCTQDGTKTATCDHDGCNVKDTVTDTGSKLPHTFDKQVANEKYLALPATCTEAAQYYYSCSCGEKGTETFTSGNALGHSFTNYVSGNNATCTQDGTKTAVCDRDGCNEKDTVTDMGSKLPHTFDKQVANEKYLASASTCTESAKYYYSCSCGKKGTETFTSGNTLGHSFTNYVSDNNATCTQDGTMTAKCDRCDETDTITDIGSALGFLITWKNYDGKVLKTTKCKYNAVPSYGNEVPIRVNDSQYSYVFNGWTPTIVVATENATYTATYIKTLCSSYTISYNANGGNNAPSSQGKVKGENVTLSSVIPDKDNHIFMGWKCANDGETYLAGENFNIDANVTLYAIWGHECEDCHGEGVISTTSTCITCSGRGSIQTSSISLCIICGGKGELLKKCPICNGSGKTPTFCSECKGFGGAFLCECSCGNRWWANETGSRVCSKCKKSVSGKQYTTCSTCQGTGQKKTTCSGCFGEGKVSSGTCSACNGSGKRTTYITNTCSSCSGSGEIIKNSTCSTCLGNKNIIDENNSYTITLFYGSSNIGYYTATLNNPFKLPIPIKNGYTFLGWFDSDENGVQYADEFGVCLFAWNELDDKNLYAHWELNHYKITYDCDDDVNLADMPTEYTVEDSSIKLNEQHKEYYNFKWLLNGQTIAAIDTATAKDLVINGIWSPVEYLIEYEYDGGVASNQTFYNIESMTFKLDTPTKLGYAFIGWTGSNGDVPQKEIVIESGSHGDLSYTANWEIINYTIYFESNGGSMVDSITQGYGSVVTAPAKPTWVEKSFVGWFTDSSLTNEYRFTTMPAENITLYAKWIEYSVSLSSDETTEISINDVVTSPDTYHATAIDTDGNPVNVVVTVIGGTFEAGKTVTVRLVATGLYGAYATKTISNIKVYGIPSLSYDTEKDYFNLSDTLNAALWNANAIDTFGTALVVFFSVKDLNYSAGDIVTIVISATDITGNEVKVEIANVKVYGAPTITRDTTKNDMKATDTVGNELFGVSAVDSFGVSLTATTVKQSGTISGGNTITVKSSVTDSKGNTHYITYTVNVYDLPTIGGATKTSFNLDDTISLDTLGIVAKDSFDNRLSNVTLTLTEGDVAAGQTLTYLVTATDHLGNVQTRTISGIRIYGTPTISFDNAKGSMKVTDEVNANLFSAVAKDSHNGELVVTVTVESGTIAGGNIVKFKLSTVDALGNEHSIVTQDIKVYSFDDITLTYNISGTARIKKTSKGEEFGASAVDSFNETCDITIEAAVGYTLAGGNTINLYIIATDALGNTKKSKLITDIKVYDTPTLSFAREYPYIQNGESPYELFLLTDSFGAEILYDITIVSGSLDINKTIVYKITGTDKAGNLFEETRELVVLDTNESILELYKNGVKIGTQRVYKGSNYTLPKESNSNVAWHLGSLVLTDDNGASLVAWDKDSGVYILTTDYYTVSYNANGGEVSITSQLVNKGASYINPVPTRVGYTFAGWYNGSTLYSDGKWPTADNVTLTAKWTANTDTVYIVRHYKQNIDDNDYTLYETQNLRGTSDSTITPSVKTYTGFTSPSTQTTTISADGSRIINYHYLRNSYTITVIGNGGTNNAICQKYQSVIDPTGWTTRDGYTLGGLYNDIGLTSEYSASTMQANDIDVYAWWSEETKPIYFTYYGTSSITITGYSGGNNVVIPSYIGNNPVQTISEGAFKDKSITDIIIPDSITSIGNGAFRGCNALASMTIPFIGASKTARDGYDEVFGYIFGYTTTKKSETISGATYQVSITPFNSFTTTYYHYYIPSSLNNVILGNAITQIDFRAFYNCGSITSISIPDSVTFIDVSAFSGCSGLTSITIPNSVTRIYSNAFSGCAGLTSVIIPDSVTILGSSAFMDCHKLKKITISKGLNVISERLFKNCFELTSITIPKNITRIDEAAFIDCYNLTRIKYEGTIWKWRDMYKGNFWDARTGKYIIHCTDGDIKKSD